jgi:hypothetical protein
MRRRRWLVILAAAALAAVAAGCSGGNSKDKTSTAGSADASPAKGTPAAASTTKTSSGGGSSSDVTAITKKFAASTFQASYKVTGGGADVSGGTMQLFKDGQKRFRFDITATQNGQQMSIVFIQKDDTSAFCLKDAGELGPLLGVDAGKGICFKATPGDANNPVANLSTMFSDIENADVKVLETSSRKVAGRDASCFRTEDNTTKDISTICFGSDGAMLYVKTEGTDANEIEATDVKSSVKAADFDLPYEVRDFPSIGGLSAPTP